MGFLSVILALCQPQLAVHDELGSSFQVRPAVRQSLGVLRGELAQHPGSQVVVRVGLGPYADADPGETVASQPGNDAFQAVVAPCRAGRPDPQLAGVLGDVVAQDD